MEGVVHVLQEIHRWLRPDGVLLDLHAEPERPRVEVYVDRVPRVYLGLVDNTSTLGNIHRARATLAAIVEDGWFTTSSSSVFDFVSHFSSVDDWLRYRQDRRSTSSVDPAIIERARESLAELPSGELRVSERLRATRLERSVQ